MRAMMFIFRATYIDKCMAKSELHAMPPTDDQDKYKANKAMLAAIILACPSATLATCK